MKDIRDEHSLFAEKMMDAGVSYVSKGKGRGAKSYFEKLTQMGFIRSPAFSDTLFLPEGLDCNFLGPQYSVLCALFFYALQYAFKFFILGQSS